MGEDMESAPSRDNYKFIGWNTAKDGTGEWFTDQTKVTKSITVYAQWQKVDSNQEYEPATNNRKVYKDEETTVEKPVFTKDGEKVELDNTRVIKYEITNPIDGVTIDQNTGAITVSKAATSRKRQQKSQLQ